MPGLLRGIDQDGGLLRARREAFWGACDLTLRTGLGHRQGRVSDRYRRHPRQPRCRCDRTPSPVCGGRGPRFPPHLGAHDKRRRRLRPASNPGPPRPLRSGRRTRRLRGPRRTPRRHRRGRLAQPRGPQRNTRLRTGRDGGGPRCPPHTAPARRRCVVGPTCALVGGRGHGVGRRRSLHAATTEGEDDGGSDTLRRRVRPLLRRRPARSGGWGTRYAPGARQQGCRDLGRRRPGRLVFDPRSGRSRRLRQVSRPRHLDRRGPEDGRVIREPGVPTELVIRQAHVLDPSTGLDGVMDLRLSSGRISEVGEGLRGTREFDADGLHLFPGFVDVHAHWRTPGREDEETLESGSAAAAAGGFTGVVMMPNTDPIVDRPVVVSGLVRRVELESRIRARVSAALHIGLAGERLTEMRLLKEAGAFCVSDDGLGTASAGVLRNGMLYARSAGLPVVLHCEDHTLATGVVHDGIAASLAGLPGSPASAEDTATATALVLAAETGAKVHITHVSTALSAALVGFFKERADVTADTTPHHLTLTEDLVSTLDGLYRVNPPLRPEHDRAGLGLALRDRVLDFVATDHAPHASEEKELPIEEAAPGFLGHETAFAALYTELVLGGRLPLKRLVEAMSCAPGRWVGSGGSLAVGAPADLTLIDLSEEWTVGRGTLVSRSSNSPYLGRTLKGRVVGTIVGGEPVHDRTGAKFGARA